MDNVHIHAKPFALPITPPVRNSKGLSEEPQRFSRFQAPKKQTHSFKARLKEHLFAKQSQFVMTF